MKHGREQQIDGCELRVHPEEGDGNHEVGVGRRHGGAAGAEVQAQRHVGSLSGSEKQIPWSL